MLQGCAFMQSQTRVSSLKGWGKSTELTTDEQAITMKDFIRDIRDRFKGGPGMACGAAPSSSARAGT
jgi:hypothetical protein